MPDANVVLSPNSPRWSELQHAYGAASDTPELLRDLEALPKSAGDQEPWFSLWSSLAHQGDVYSASFAAVPHVIRALSRAPEKADFAFFQFPAWVEICRQKKDVPIPKDLNLAYFESLQKLPALVAAAGSRDWDSGFLACALAAIAAAKGFGSVAEAVMELNPETSEQFMEWLFQN